MHTLICYQGWGRLSNGGLINFGEFSTLRVQKNCAPSNLSQNLCQQQLWTVLDLLIFAAMGVCGGLLGALWCAMQTRITKWRMKHVRTPQRQLAEAMLVAFTNTSVMFLSKCVCLCGAGAGVGRCVRKIARAKSSELSGQ
jgi:chloride channel 6